ncbi:hypothetical protein, partial [Wolbachia endosymbiont of Drosophila auraria]
MRLYGKLDPSVSYSDDRRGDWDSKRRILKRQTSKKTYVKSSINENYTFFMHAMVFIINGECDMALNDRLSNKTEQELINDNDFINALVGKLTAGQDPQMYPKGTLDTKFNDKVNVTGSNLQLPAFVTALAARDGANGVYTKAAADAALANKLNVDGTNISDPFVTALTTGGTNNNRVYTKTAANTELATKAELLRYDDNGNQVPITSIADLVPRLAAGAGDNGVYTKTAADTKFDGKVNVDGSNATDPGVTAMLGKLIDANKVLKVDGSNATDPGVTAMLGKLTGANIVAKIDASNLTDAANKKAFAEAILPAQDGNKSILVNKLGEALDRVQNNANDKVYGAAGQEKIAKDFLADKYPFAKIDASNLTDAASKKAFAEAILPAQDGNKSILVNKLGEALDRVQ